MALLFNLQGGARSNLDATSAARRTKVEGAWSGTARTRFDLAYDNRGFVKTAKRSGTAFADYYTGTSYGSVYDAHAYDARGQLQTTAKYRGTPGAGTPPSADELPGRRFEYRYDAMGNRTSAGATGSTGGGDDEYVPNARNQYATKENNSLKVLGTAAAEANVGAQSSSGGARTAKRGHVMRKRCAKRRVGDPPYSEDRKRKEQLRREAQNS